MPDYCLEHVNTALIPDETGAPTCWVCTAIKVAELADSFGIIDPDGQDRVVTKEEFVESLLAQA